MSSKHSSTDKHPQQQQQTQQSQPQTQSQQQKHIEKIENYYRTSENVYRLSTDHHHPMITEWITNYPKQLNFRNHLQQQQQSNNSLRHYNYPNLNNDLYELYVDVNGGYKPENITVTTKNDLLIINGFMEQNNGGDNYGSVNGGGVNGGGYHSKEFCYKYQLPKYVCKDKMTCMFKLGGNLLHIEAPIEQPNTRHIPIKILNEPSTATTNNNNIDDNPHQSTTKTTSNGLATNASNI